MPISAKEKTKIEQHSASENIDKDMMHSTPGKFGIYAAIRGGASIFTKKPGYILFGISDAIAVTITAYLLVMMQGITLTGSSNNSNLSSHAISIIEVLAAFFFYFVFISAPLSSFYKSRLAGIRYPGTLKVIAGSLSIMQPLCYILLFAGIILTSEIMFTGLLGPAALILGFILYVMSINQSLLPYFLVDANNSRSNAISHGWLLLSNSTLKLLATNIAIFLPTLLLLILFIATQNLYTLVLMAIIFLVSEGIWYGTTVSIHKSVSKVQYNYKLA